MICYYAAFSQPTYRVLYNTQEERCSRKALNEVTSTKLTTIDLEIFVVLDTHKNFLTVLTLELRMSHTCDTRGRALSAAVAFLRQNSQVALSAHKSLPIE